MKRCSWAVALGIAIVLAGTVASQANCLKKAAVASAGSEKSAKWYALETMVQSVSWSLWPSYLADGSTPGWKITRQRYRCRQSGFGVTCRGQATFCQTKK
jgi:hypothetical protein